MNMNTVITCDHLVSSILRPCCSGNSKIPRVPNSWYSQQRTLLFVSLVALVAFPASVSAAPSTLPGTNVRIRQNSSNSGSNSSSGGVSMSVWLPILLVTLAFIVFSLVTCCRRCAAANAAASARSTTTTTASVPASENTATTAPSARPRRRPRRTPSEISTKSLPPYMKEPGDQELVLFRGPTETEDDQVPPSAMPVLPEDENERSEEHGPRFDIGLERLVSVDTMADSSTTNLIRTVSVSAPVPRPPELHLATHGHNRSVDRRSLESVGSEAELLAGHQRGISVESHVEPRGEAPPYMEPFSNEAGMTVVSLNDPEISQVPLNAVAPPPNAAGRWRPRFSFLMHNPFSPHANTNGASSDGGQPPLSISTESLAQMRNGSVLSRYSSHESHESHHSRTSSRNNNHFSRPHGRSNSNLFRSLHSQSPGVQAGSSTISLDSISSPLTHTLKRAEFHAPKRGLLTPEQMKLITSREALERFGVPYGPDAVAAFSRERLAGMEPPPDFESVQQERPGASRSGTSGEMETVVQRSDAMDPESALPRPTSAMSALHSSLSHRPDVRPESRASTVYTTATESEADSLPQEMETHASEDNGGPDESPTARPMTPETARPSNPSVAQRP